MMKNILSLLQNEWWDFSCLQSANSNIFDQISNINKAQVPLGFGRTIGNKGAVLIRFLLNETSIVWAWWHLQSGEEKSHKRVKHWCDITDLAFGNYDRESSFNKHQVQFFMGDLNFRVENSYEETIELLNEINDENRSETIQYLFNKDQLSILAKEYQWLKKYKEMKVDFLPTYKYDKESDIYDTSDKMRVPSWWDRILWSEMDGENEEIENDVCSFCFIISLLSSSVVEADWWKPYGIF